MVFALDGSEYGVPISQVREIISVDRVTRVPGAPDHVVGVFNLRGRVVTLVDLSAMLGHEARPAAPGGQAVVAEVERHTFGVRVDGVSRILRLDGVLDAPSMSRRDPADGLVRGVARLPGGLLVVLDLSRLFPEKELRRLDAISG